LRASLSYLVAMRRQSGAKRGEAELPGDRLHHPMGGDLRPDNRKQRPAAAASALVRAAARWAGTARSDPATGRALRQRRPHAAHPSRPATSLKRSPTSSTAWLPNCRISYAGLERKVEERAHQLELANLAKSRFLAAASHDLRQPVQALGLFVEQLHGHMKSAEGGRLVKRIDAAVVARSC
jgi:signal transduction histidine kinase